MSCAIGFDFRGAQANHVLVVERLVVDVAGDVLLFEAADAMLESRRAGNGPRPRERCRDCAGTAGNPSGIRFEMHRNFGQVSETVGIFHGSAPFAR